MRILLLKFGRPSGCGGLVFRLGRRLGFEGHKTANLSLRTMSAVVSLHDSLQSKITYEAVRDAQCIRKKHKAAMMLPLASDMN